MPGLRKYQLILISLFAGVVLTLSWPVKGFPVLLLIGLVPFLFIEEYIHRNRDDFGKVSVFLYTYPGFLLWNVLTTWWIWNSTDIGAILAFVLNAMFMSIVFQVYHMVRKVLPGNKGPIILAFLWISFEYIHHRWDITWPWLSLGNGFAAWYKWIQWYEFTGIFGGTLWIFLSNILIFKWILNMIDRKPKPGQLLPLVSALLVICIPVILSFYIYRHYTERSWPVDVIVVQPNVDPYNEQYELPPSELLQRNLSLATQAIDTAAEYIVCPESALQENIWEGRIEQSPSIQALRRYLSGHPGTAIVIGASTYKEYEEGEALSATARQFRDSERYYDAYNTAVYIDTDSSLTLHHKSKLTPGVEKMPFSRIMKPVEKLAINLGGTVGSLGTDQERTVFKRAKDGLGVGPAICYESVFGEYVTEYIRKGANLIFVITNDGWWGNTPGHRQHLTFSSLRAIETRRSIARSANTGISAFFNQRGDMFQVTSYWEPVVIRQQINANDSITFYVRYGDYIGRLSVFISVFVILIAVSRAIGRKKRLPLE